MSSYRTLQVPRPDTNCVPMGFCNVNNQRIREQDRVFMNKNYLKGQ